MNCSYIRSDFYSSSFQPTCTYSFNSFARFERSLLFGPCEFGWEMIEQIDQKRISAMKHGLGKKLPTKLVSSVVFSLF